MNQKLYSILLIVAFIIFSLERSIAQNGLAGRNNIKASHGIFSMGYSQNFHQFQLEYNRGLTKFIELGTYLSTYKDFYSARRVNPFTNEPYIATFDTRAYHYGIQANLHPLQLLLSEGHRFRLDLYLNAKLGGKYSPVFEDALRQKEHFFEYDIGAGMAHHIFQHWGLFIEYNYRAIGKIRYGLSIKF